MSTEFRHATSRFQWVATIAALMVAGCRHDAGRSNPLPRRPPPASKVGHEAAPTPPQGAAKQTVDAGEAAAPSTTDAASAAARVGPPPPAKQAENLLRHFVELLAAGRVDEARALFVDEAICRQLFAPKYDCRTIAEAQRDGFQNFVDDPVPLGSKVTGVWVPEGKEFGAERGFVRPTRLWPGAIVTVEAPQGYAFQIRSLSVFDTPAGLRIMWGKRRSGPDPPRSPEKRKALLQHRASRGGRSAANETSSSARHPAARQTGAEPPAPSTPQPAERPRSGPAKTKR